MSHPGMTTSRPSLAQGVGEVFAGSKEVLALARRLAEIADTLPLEARGQRGEILRIAAELGSSAMTVVRGQQSAVEAISRKTVL